MSKASKRKSIKQMASIFEQKYQELTAEPIVPPGKRQQYQMNQSLKNDDQGMTKSFGKNSLRNDQKGTSSVKVATVKKTVVKQSVEMKDIMNEEVEKKDIEKKEKKEEEEKEKEKKKVIQTVVIIPFEEFDDDEEYSEDIVYTKKQH